MKKKTVKEEVKEGADKWEYELNQSKHLLKITKETPVKYIKWDVELSPAFERFLVFYADTKMSKKVKEDLMIEWALIDMLKNIVTGMDKKNAKSNKR